MILRSYPSLGLLPAIIVMLAVMAVVVILGFVIIRIESGRAVVLVPMASCIGEARPGVPDEEYAKVFANIFIQYWTTWNDVNCRYRINKAVELMAQSAQGEFVMRTAVDAEASAVMAKSQSFTVTEINITKNGQLYQAAISGDLKVYYGGLGGKPDRYEAILLLQPITPTSHRPVALEVIGFIEQRH